MARNLSAKRQVNHRLEMKGLRNRSTIVIRLIA